MGPGRQGARPERVRAARRPTGARLPIISIGGYYREGKTLADIGREMEAYRAGRHGGLQVQGRRAHARGRRGARRGRARRAAGPDFVLAVDANRGWSVGGRGRASRGWSSRSTSRWFEEPCHWHDDAAHDGARCGAPRASRSPPASPRSPATRVRRLLDAGAVDFVNFDASEGGGVTEWRRAAALCAAAGVQMAHHEEPQIAQHLLAAVPHGTYVECFADPERDPVWQRMWANRPAIKDGMMALSAAGPASAWSSTQAMIERYRVA